VCRTCDANEFARSSPFSNCDASHKLPAVFEATVKYFRSYTRELFVQDGDAAIYIFLTKDPKLSPGDRILVRGVTQAGFHPLVECSDMTLAPWPTSGF
jgi:hypothetical protein